MPVSLTANGDVVVCGGQLGELTVLRRSTGATQTLSLGSSINNAAHISSRPGQDLLLVSNNDRFVHVFGLNDLVLRESIELPAPVNHASVSHDGRHLVACGDTDTVYLFDVREGGYHSRIALPSTPSLPSLYIYIYIISVHYCIPSLAFLCYFPAFTFFSFHYCSTAPPPLLHHVPIARSLLFHRLFTFISLLVYYYFTVVYYYSTAVYYYSTAVSYYFTVVSYHFSPLFHYHFLSVL